MNKVNKILDTVIRFVMAVAMFLMLALGTLQIVTTLMGSPSSFTDEFLRYLLIWASMIGSAYCFYKDEHLALELVTDRVHGVAKVILNLVIEVAVLFFVGYVFIYGGWKLAMNATNISSVMHIPMKVLYMIFPVSGVFIYLARVLKYVGMVIEKKGENK